MWQTKRLCCWCAAVCRNTVLLCVAARVWRRKDHAVVNCIVLQCLTMSVWRRRGLGALCCADECDTHLHHTCATLQHTVTRCNASCYSLRRWRVWLKCGIRRRRCFVATTVSLFFSLSHTHSKRIKHTHSNSPFSIWIHIWMSDVTHMNKACHGVMLHVWTGHVTYVNVSCQAYNLFMSHTYAWIRSHIEFGRCKVHFAHMRGGSG